MGHGALLGADANFQNSGARTAVLGFSFDIEATACEGDLCLGTTWSTNNRALCPAYDITPVPFDWDPEHPIVEVKVSEIVREWE